ncbi:MAG: DUF1501 domain-containing protein [Caldimonas sp.]
MTMNASRRAFLQRASALSLAGTAAPWALNLAALGEAAASGAPADYKALVCVFLYGGNDYGNTLIPVDPANYAAYAGMRPTLAYPAASLAPTTLAPVGLAAGRQYALAPELAPLLPHYAAGRLGVMLNVGTLIQPTTKAQYTNASVPLPPKLFSHNDQQSVWQSSAPEGAASGWGGRMGDLFVAGNGNATFTCVNVSGNAVFLSGSSAVQYQVSTSGPVAFAGLASPLFGSAACSSALQSLVTAPRTHLFENEYTRVASRSISAGGVLTAALAAAPVIATPFPAGNPLADQLKFVARMISTAATTSTKRQVFFVSIGGFDTHDGLASVHPGLLTNVAGAMSAFYQSTVELGVASQVTAFTASDFGRTLTADDGSDHGWGSMHFMLGGAVNGGRFYGTAPAVANNGPDDVGQGRLLPSTAVDQYAATLGKWFGVSDTELLAVLPNLGNYSAGQRNLGFV